MDPWTPKFTKADEDPNRVIRFLIKTNLRVICLFTARAVDSEWTHMWPATSVNNHGRTDYLRLSHLAALSAGVNNYSSYSADSNARSNNFNTIFWSDVPSSDVSGSWLPVVLKRWYDNMKKKKSRVGCLLLTHCEKGIGFLFGSVRYRINISVFVINMTTRTIWYIIFEPSFWQERAVCF